MYPWSTSCTAWRPSSVPVNVIVVVEPAVKLQSAVEESGSHPGDRARRRGEVDGRGLAARRSRGRGSDSDAGEAERDRRARGEQTQAAVQDGSRHCDSWECWETLVMGQSVSGVSASSRVNRGMDASGASTVM